MKQFKAESKKLLDLVINSIYTEKDVFLRELISNASDAYDKLVLENNETLAEKSAHEIVLSYDRDARTITVSDDGIGMTAEELEENLGTIAHSASLEVKSQDEARTSENVDIIGQFGVGFYASFMVADYVTVTSKSAHGGNAHVWKSDGVEGFTVEDGERAEHGTDVTLHMRPNDGAFDYDKFFSHAAIKELVKRYSDYIRYPIVMDVTGRREVPAPEGAKNWEPQFEDYEERVVLNSMTPIWARLSSEVTEDDYNAFYMNEFGDTHPPLRTITMHARGGHNCDVLLFIPSEPPADFFSGDYKRGLELYSSNVLIQERCEDLVSEAFGFLRGIVDSPDISLNLSRQSMQEDPFVRDIAKQIEKRVKMELEAMRDNERDTYVDFYSKFGRIFKFAIYATFGKQNEALEDLLMFFTARNDEPVTLKEYREAMPKNQPIIFYASGNRAERLEDSPSVTAITDRGFDVILCTESVDEFCLVTLRSYQGIPIKNVTAGDLQLETTNQRHFIEKTKNENAELFKTMRGALGPDVVEVTVTTRLSETPACISARGPVSLGMEKYFSSTQDAQGTPRVQHVLELNPNHRVFDTLVKAWSEGDKALVKRYATVLYGQSMLAEGLEPHDMKAYARAVYELM